MSEMLGNHYFLARKYSLATRELESALSKDPSNKHIRRKLIICYVQTRKISRAKELFYHLVKQDISFIVETDPIIDDCPCPELVYDLEEQLEDDKNFPEYLMKLGIIWLYCDIKKSIHYFNILQTIEPNDKIIKEILFHLTSYVLKKEVS